jgi:hypothetical protein
MTRDVGSRRPSADERTADQLAAAGDAAPDEYRYRPWVPGPCPEHPACILIACHRLRCPRPAHVRLGRGRPARFCSARCRVAEHRFLNQ